MNNVKISFWHIFWPTIIASLILSALGWVFWILVFTGLTAEEPETASPAVLHLKLNGTISDRSDAAFDGMSFTITNKIGLADLLVGFENAKNDPDVKGIYLDLGAIDCGYATAFEIRKALTDFRASGKFITAYLSGEVISQKQYLISSAASEIYGFPSATMEFVGLGAELMFYKNTFDKLGLEMQVIRGANNDFKSAVEPYFMDKMSDSSRFQLQQYITSMWGDYCKTIATERGVSEIKLNQIANELKIQRLSDAYKFKLIDGLCYQDEVENKIMRKANLADGTEIMSFETYAKNTFEVDQLGISDIDKRIAVINAEGSIMVDGDEIASRKLIQLFREVRKDKSIKGVVFRVNSPGGSALASEEIWREVELTAQVKTLVVSMGDVAASGGYYIATPAEIIFAEPTTITGSIGVFGVIPYTGRLLEKNLGLSFDRVQTHQHSVLSLNRKLTVDELSIIQGEVNSTYELFKSRVANGRKLTLSQVNRIARGRVWTGAAAVKVGLVDKLGGLNDAISYLSTKLSLKDPIVQYWPKVTVDPIQELLEKISEETTTALKVKTISMPKVLDQTLKELAHLEQWTGIQMRLPYTLKIN
jgi:protease-4